MKPIPVVFRKWNNGEVFALFPTVPHNWEYRYCTAYGRGGYAASPLYLPNTKLATPEEYADLLRELWFEGYDSLRIVKRISHNMHRERIAATKDLYKDIPC